MDPRKMRAVIAGAVLTAFALAGCGGGSGPGTGGETAGVRVGVPESGNAVSAHLAERAGYFDEVGLDVELVTIRSGAEAVPMMMNGQLDISLGDGIGTLTASANGVPIGIFGIATIQPAEPERDATAVFTGQPVASAADFAGRTFGVSQLGGAAELTAKAAIDAKGGDSGTVRFVEIATEQMAAAIASGTIDAGLLTEPFATAAERQGLHLWARPSAAGSPGKLATTWVTTFPFGREHPDVLQRFVTAIQKAGITANADPAKAREAAGTFMPAPPDTIAAIRFPVFSENVADTSVVRDFVEFANSYDVFPKPPDLDTVLSVQVTPQ